MPMAPRVALPSSGSVQLAANIVTAPTAAQTTAAVRNRLHTAASPGARKAAAAVAYRAPGESPPVGLLQKHWTPIRQIAVADAASTAERTAPLAPHQDQAPDQTQHHDGGDQEEATLSEQDAERVAHEGGIQLLLSDPGARLPEARARVREREGLPNAAAWYQRSNITEGIAPRSNQPNPPTMLDEHVHSHGHRGEHECVLREHGQTEGEAGAGQGAA